MNDNEQKSEKRETLADIERDLRDRADCAERHGDRETHNDGVAMLLRSIADRIEAIDSADAWRSLYSPGNAAAMREALDKVGNAAAWIAESCNDQQTAKYMNDVIAIVQAALSAPARNCDRFSTVGDAVREYLAYTERHGGATIAGIADWLFATAKQETKGEGDGR